MKWDFKMILSIAGTIAALSAGVGATYGLYLFDIKKKKRKIAQKLSGNIKEHLRGKGYIKKGEIIKIIQTEKQVGDYFMKHTLDELRVLNKLTTIELLNRKF